MSDLKNDIKQLIIDALGLEDISVSDIGDEQTLFGDGLGLDSVDALELGLAIQKTYGIKIDADAKDTRNHFSNVASLAAFVTAKQAAWMSKHIERCSAMNMIIKGPASPAGVAPAWKKKRKRVTAKPVAKRTVKKNNPA